MPLQNDVQQIRYNGAGADLMTQSQTLRSQRSATDSEISTLRPKIKADVANEIWVRADIERLMELLRLRDSLDNQMANCKTAIQELRAVIADPGYAAELLAEENLLP